MIDISSANTILSEIRKKAEAILARHPRPPPPSGEGSNLLSMEGLVHELQVHEIELEMQIAESQRVAEEAEGARAKFEALFEYAPMGYLTLDAGQLITGVNLAMMGMLGRDRSEFLLRPLTEFILPESQDTFYLIIRQCASDFARRQGVVNLLNGNNQSVTCMLECVHLSRSTNPNESFLITVTDLSSSKRIQGLISEAVHELKTPLTVILGWSGILLSAKQHGENLDAICDLEDLKSLVRSAERLNALIDNFLDAGRIESGRLELHRERVNVSEIVTTARQVVDYFALQKNMTIQENLALTPEISIDRRRIEQVVINLLTNAIKYSPDHGQVKITTKLIAISGKEMISIQVLDRGYGFTPEELAGATTPFGKSLTRQDQKQKIQGTGLGLYLSRRIVEQHGGLLTIHSEGVNKGTEVEVLLPVEENLHA